MEKAQIISQNSQKQKNYAKEKILTHFPVDRSIALGFGCSNCCMRDHCFSMHVINSEPQMKLIIVSNTWWHKKRRGNNLV